MLMENILKATGKDSFFLFLLTPSVSLLSIISGSATDNLMITQRMTGQGERKT